MSPQAVEIIAAIRRKKEEHPPSEQTAEALEVIKAIPNAVVYLGGSRAFALRALQHGKAVELRPGTDWDYYATHTLAIEHYLTDNGFVHSDSGGYDLDSEAISILVRDSVEIVLRRDAEFYKKVIESIPTYLFYERLWKSSPVGVDRSAIQPIFNMLFAVAHGFEKT